MNTYYVARPRGIDNEFTLYAASTSEGRKLANDMLECSYYDAFDCACGYFRRITRREAERLARRHDNFYHDSYGEYVSLDILAAANGQPLREEQYTRDFWAFLRGGDKAC